MGKIRGKLTQVAANAMYPDNERGNARVMEQAQNGMHNGMRQEEIANILLNNPHVRREYNSDGKYDIYHAPGGDESKERHVGWFTVRNGGMGMGEISQKDFDAIKDDYDKMKAEEALQAARAEMADNNCDVEQDPDFSSCDELSESDLPF